MSLNVDLTFEELESTIREFFKDYFESMHFKQSEIPQMPVLSSEVPLPNLTLIGYRGSYKFGYTFFMYQWDRFFKEGSQFHRLEHLKGECVINEQTIELQKPLY